MISRRKHGWIGIDFGTKVAKIAQLERAGDRVRWNRAVVPCSGGSCSLTCTGDELRHALEVHGGFHGHIVACTLPMSSTELRTVTVPPGSDSERRAMIALELDAAAGTQQPREFDFWQPAAPTGAGGEQDGLQVLSVATSTITDMTDALAAAELECAVLDGLPCALARAVEMAPAPAATGPVAAIDWGHVNATLSIVEGGRAQFTRLLRDCGAGALINESSQVLGLDEAEAAELLARFGLPGVEGAGSEENEICEVVADIVGGHLQRMIDELTRTFAFLRLQRQALVPTRACLFGAGATVKNAAALLAAKLELPCDVWRLANEEGPETQAAGEPIFGPAAALSALAWIQ